MDAMPLCSEPHLAGSAKLQHCTLAAGHSLGGALATLAALDIAREVVQLRRRGYSIQVGCCAAPRCAAPAGQGPAGAAARERICTHLALLQVSISGFFI